MSVFSYFWHLPIGSTGLLGHINLAGFGTGIEEDDKN